MQAFSGIVTALNCFLSGLIGVRLVRLAIRSRGPEAWLALYLVAGMLLGTLLSAAVFVTWADPSLAMPDAWRPPLHALLLAANSLGMIGIAMFTYRVFRPTQGWARNCVAAVIAVAVLSFVLTAWIDDFQVHVIQNPSYFAAVAVRIAAMVWMTAESFLYYGQVRRRQRLGLADPLLANRFLLWGIWAGAMSLMQLADPIGRVWYWWITGTTVEWVPAAGKPIIVFMIGTSSALGAITGVTLFLTFFPTPAYRRWIAARSPSS